MANYDIEARVRLVAGNALKQIKDLQDAAKDVQKAIMGGPKAMQEVRALCKETIT